MMPEVEIGGVTGDSLTMRSMVKSTPGTSPTSKNQGVLMQQQNGTVGLDPQKQKSEGTKSSNAVGNESKTNPAKIL